MKLLIAFLKCFNRKVADITPQVGDTILYYGLYPWNIIKIDGDHIIIRGCRGDIAQTRLSYGGWTINPGGESDEKMS